MPPPDPLPRPICSVSPRGRTQKPPAPSRAERRVFWSRFVSRSRDPSGTPGPCAARPMRDKATWRRLGALSVFCQVLLWAGLAVAGSGRVAIVANASDEPVFATALLRVEGEL